MSRVRAALAVAAAALAVAGLAPPTSGAVACDTVTCAIGWHEQQQRKWHQHLIRARWGAAVREYGPALLDARAQCESGHHGKYRLSTTGNGYWFAFQFDVAAWTGAGGAYRRGRPAGKWSLQPGRLEQRYRAVRWDGIHGGDAWPNCP